MRSCVLLVSFVIACTTRASAPADTSTQAISTAAPTESPAVVEAPVDPVAAPVDAGPKGLEPLDEQLQAIFMGSPADDPPEIRDGITGEVDETYVASNERRLDAFASTIRDIGGGYIGVGSDQAYLLIGWARPEVAWFIDYDPAVVDIHMVYRALLRAADTPEEFLRLWEQEVREEAIGLVEQEPGAKQLHVRAYINNRAWVRRRLNYVVKVMNLSGTPSWLTDADTYEFVRSMVLADRVRPMIADLNGDVAVLEVAEAARKLGVPIRVLYLSNAEGYWRRYESGFRRNIAALPFDERSVLLRTILIWSVNNDYCYNVQPALNYVDWLSQPFVKNVWDVVHDQPEHSPTELNFLVTEGDPDDSPAARRASRAAE
jgi:hypothetical protein